MAITSRQAELFAGETWTTIYQAFAQINFNASDPVTINAALQNYIRVNYPEDFNDWIVSSEFVALIDLLSWLAGTLAYKTDLASRENFLDTAESKDSILRLARFLSYNPSRAQCASGILKITNVTTDDDVFDSFGSNLANTTITWNDPNNGNWFEQFTNVMNNAFVNTNPFGVPLKTGTVSSVATQLYRVNGFAADSANRFSSNVTGTSMDFELCNGDFYDGTILFERTPNPQNALNLYYLNDGNGSGSARTGFFVLFKQGSTQTADYNITVPVENQTLNINSNNINQSDVWVQTVDDAGNVLVDWTKVPAITNSNITFNDVPDSQRNIFSVLSRENDQITLRFSDGRFGNAPIGNIRCTYRVSNGLSYQIKPLEINNINVPLRYYNAVGAFKTLNITLSLFETVGNSAVAETVEQIRQRAPQVYATQNRMVSGEDYNSFPLSSNLAAKIKAVNRVYSGQSRYIDLFDPTGTYQDLSLFADDGILFTDPHNTYIEVPTGLNKSVEELISEYLLPAVDQYTTTTAISDTLMRYVQAERITAQPHNTWTQSSANLFETTGWFSVADNLIQPGAIIQFNIHGVNTWVAVVAISGTSVTTTPDANTAGPVTLASEVPSGSPVVAILPSVSVLPSSAVMAAVSNNLSLRLTCSLWYDYNPLSSTGPVWVVGPAVNNLGPAELGNVNGGSGTALLMMTVSYSNAMWQFNVRGLSYTFESIDDVEWFDNGNRALAQRNGEAKRDSIRLLRINRDLNDTGGRALPSDINLDIDRLWLYSNGTAEPRRVSVLLADSNADGYPDVPDTFYRLTHQADARQRHLFWSNVANPPFDVPIFNVVGYDTDTLRLADDPPLGTIGFQLTSTVSPLQNQTFWVHQGNHVWQPDMVGAYRMEIGRGPNVAASWVGANGTDRFDVDSLVFHWRHYAPSDHRLDPAPTNLHDIFVLTFSYDTSIRQWISAGAIASDMPSPPTELELRLAFAPLEQFKMFGDQIVWRPVRYKFLFGATAAPELQAQFKVVRLPTAQISDGEIKTRIINAINTYFAVGNWDFGETFYYTEMAAYIHQQLSGLIGSVVLVPSNAESSFGDGFEVACRGDEMFLSTAQVSDIVLIQSNTALNLRIR